MTNTLYYGDNLDILRRYVRDESVDLVYLNPPTVPMRREVASAGFYKSPWGSHPRIQILTIEDLLGGKTVDYPQAADVTFKRAKRVRTGPAEKQNHLPMKPD